MRYWNQWLQSGLLEGVQAVVFGNFTECGVESGDVDAHIYREFAARSKCPVFVSAAFGHVSPNTPLMIGAEATISNSTLSWRTNLRLV